MSTSQGFTPDELDTIWVTYQEQGAAACPHCDSKLSLELTQDPAETASERPEILVNCSGCGRKSASDPGERHHSEQDPV